MSKRKKSVQKPPRLHRNQATVSKPSLTKRKQQETVARRKLASGDKVPKHQSGPQYHESQQILCVGEGNFSFARALVRTLEGVGQNLFATAYDARDTVDAKYQVSHRHNAQQRLHKTDSYKRNKACTRAFVPVLQEGGDPVSEIIEELQDCDVTLCYAVDATQLAKSLQVSTNSQNIFSKRDPVFPVVLGCQHIALYAHCSCQ